MDPCGKEHLVACSQALPQKIDSSTHRLSQADQHSSNVSPLVSPETLPGPPRSFCLLVFSIAYKPIRTVRTMLWKAKRSSCLRGQIQILVQYTAGRGGALARSHGHLWFPGTNNIFPCKVEITIGLLVNSCNGKHHHLTFHERIQKWQGGKKA